MIKPVLIWGYFIEIVLSGIIMALAYFLIGFSEVNGFIRNSSIEMATVVGGGTFAASLAFFWALFTNSDSKFYRWLAQKGAYSVYTTAAAYSAFVSLALIITLIVARYSNNECVPVAGFALLLLAVINIITLVKNIIELMRLQNLFNERTSKPTNGEN